MLPRIFLGTVCVLLSWVFESEASSRDADVRLRAEFLPHSVHSREYTILSLTIDVPRGYHLYSMTKIPEGPRPLEVMLDAEWIQALGGWYCPRPEVTRDENFNKLVEHYTGTISCKRAFRVIAKQNGKYKADIIARGQICDDSKCLVFNEKQGLSLNVDSGAVRQKQKEPPHLKGELFNDARKVQATLHSASDDGSLPLANGLWAFLIIAFLAGLGAIATPCVFPMIPITVSYFSKYSQISTSKAFVAAATYALSIVISFTFIGILVSVIFGAVGMQVLSSSPWFNIVLTALLVLFAFNLFGLFEMRLPNWLIASTSDKERSLTNRHDSMPRQLLGIFFMALTFTLVSFTCTVGFVGVVLTEAAKGNWFFPALGMLVFSIAFSSPFFFLALFPSWAQKLQGKGGDWMIAIKVTLGFFELAAAFKFLSNIDLVWQWGLVTRPFVLVVWVALFLTAALYLLRIFSLPSNDSEKKNIGPIRMLFAVALLAICVHLFSGIGNIKSMGGWLDGWLPPAVYPGQEGDYATTSQPETRLSWIIDNIPLGLQRGQERNQPVFIDFTGYTCTNCRFMEGAIFTESEVLRRFNKMVLVRAYTDALTQVSEEQRAYQLERFHTAALPFYAIVDPRDDTVLATFASMTNSVAKYLAFLDKGIDSFNDKTSRRKDTDPDAETDASVSQHGADGGLVAPPETSISLATKGEKADFELPTLKESGKEFSLSSKRGHWIFVNFWATWCVPCLKELNEDIPAALRDAPNVQLVTVAFDGDETRQKALKILAAAKLPRHIALLGGEDFEKARLDGAFSVSSSLPQSFLIHPDGHIAWLHRGSITRDTLSRLFELTR